jgi:predicted metal-dependent HD superfamily phosphohydrolase
MSGRPDLTARWPLAHAEAVRDELLAAYADPARGYHDTRHLSEVLDRLDELAGAGTPFDRLPVELAAWFHDAVYDGRPGDEERSAQWAEDVLAAHEPRQVGEVVRLVRLTETHRPADDDRNGCALSDADLAILAASPERYAEYVADVRREYAHVADDDFRAGRTAVLTDLLAKPRLFHTAHARETWETVARVNIEAELARLT